MYAGFTRDPEARLGLTEADLDKQVAEKLQPIGLDQQGRYPTRQPIAADAATDVGADDDKRDEMDDLERVLLVVVYALSGAFVLALGHAAWRHFL